MSKSTRKRASGSTKIIKKVVDPLHENIFALPWKKSDTILVVEGTEFHVHRTILTMHSPVFDAMFGGNFKEAKEKRVPLPGKTAEVMLQFLKLLYPESMIRTPLIDFTLENKIAFSVLRIADEYQTEELMRKCLEKIVILTTNVFDILPYANKYNHKVREKCVRHIAKHVTMDQIKDEKKFCELEAPLREELLFAKCEHLESRTRSSQDSSSESSSDSSSE